MGIRGEPIPPGWPWQSGYAERLIGTIRRECVNHLIVFGEAHLRWSLREYAAYYNGLRTHRALNQDSLVHHAVLSIGAITSGPPRLFETVAVIARYLGSCRLRRTSVLSPAMTPCELWTFTQGGRRPT